MSKAQWWAIGRAVFCAAVAALDFTAAAIFGGWINYTFGALMAALTVPNILQARQRKAEPAMPSNDWTQIGYTNGGLISGPVSVSFTATPQPAPSTSPSKKAQDFHGLPFDFALGEVYGLRMWHMDAYGRLRARNWHNAPPWRPGVNVAKCVSKPDEDYLASFVRAAGMRRGTDTQPPKLPHDVPSENCGCGFYAYTDPRHAETVRYNTDNNHVILGIVKGTGRALIGTQGFRCEKAEIVALRDPTRGGTKTDPWRLRQLDNLKRVYPDVPLLPSREALLEFAPLTNTLPDPSSDEFWSLP